jgi:mono/diheme cytochrome c family protein
MHWRFGTAGAFIACTFVAVGLAAPRVAAQEPDGAALYKQHCRSCHGGQGVPSQRMLALYPTLKSLADSAYLATLSTDSIAAVTRSGVGDMKPYADKLSPAEIEAVAQYVKTLASLAARQP